MTEQEQYQQLLTELRSKKGYICDMDGVIYHGNRLATKWQPSGTTG